MRKKIKNEQVLRRVSFLLFALAILVGVTTYAVAQDCKHDTNVENPSPYSDVLPDSYRVIILSADTVEWMLIDGWTFNDSLVFQFGEPIGEILSKHSSNDSIFNDRIKKLLLSPFSFQIDSVAKECTFIPDFGVLFKSDIDSLFVLYSSYCDMCRFQSKDEFWDYDGTIIRKELFSLLKEGFPKDKYVRNITR